jgi:hypothetical protein
MHQLCSVKFSDGGLAPCYSVASNAHKLCACQTPGVVIICFMLLHPVRFHCTARGWCTTCTATVAEKAQAFSAITLYRLVP